MFQNYNELPAHIRAAHTPEQRAYYEAAYFNHPHGFGPESITAQRKLEMQIADTEQRDFFLSYWPETALENLERFKVSHYDAEPDPVFSPVGDRLRRYYPDLFAHLGCRMEGLADVLDTHPTLRPLVDRYDAIKADYFRMLAAAEELCKHLTGKPKQTRRHKRYREVFAAIYPNLKRLLEELVQERKH